MFLFGTAENILALSGERELKTKSRSCAKKDLLELRGAAELPILLFTIE